MPLKATYLLECEEKSILLKQYRSVKLILVNNPGCHFEIFSVSFQAVYIKKGQQMWKYCIFL